MSLADEIQSRLLKAKSQEPTGSQQAAAQAVFQAKTGKAAAGGTTPRASAVGESAAAGAVAAQAAQQQAQLTQAAQGVAQGQAELAARAGEQQAELETQARLARADVAAGVGEAAAARTATARLQQTKLSAQESAANARLAATYNNQLQELASRRGVATADLWQSFDQGNAELSQRKDAAQLEQAVFARSLTDRQYIDNLTRVGNERRLTNEGAFRDEVTRMTLGTRLDELIANSNLGIQLGMERNQLNQRLEQMDANMALEIYKTQAKDATMKSMLDNIGAVGGSAAQVNWKKSNTTAEGDSVDYTADSETARTV